MLALLNINLQLTATVSIASLGPVTYSPSIATMAVSLAVSEIFSIK